MSEIRINDYITTTYYGDKKFKVVKKNTGYKQDCFDTDINERYFIDNRLKSWKRVRRTKNAQA